MRGRSVDFDGDIGVVDGNTLVMHTALGGGKVLVIDASRGFRFEEEGLEPLVFRLALADLAFETVNVLVAVTFARGDLGGPFLKLAMHGLELSLLPAQMRLEGMDLFLGLLLGLFCLVDAMMR